jgi:hypothetical protein
VTPPRKRWTWWEKAAAELGRRRWPAAELARLIQEGPEKVRKWLSGKHAPLEGAVAKIAAALGWSERFLRDPDTGPLDWPQAESLDELTADWPEEAKRGLKRAVSVPRMRAALIAFGEAQEDGEGTAPPAAPSGGRR